MARMQETTELSRIADLEKKLADCQVSVQELEGKLLKDISVIHSGLIEYKRSNDSTVGELRAVLERVVSRRQ